MRHQFETKGFTLVELLIVVAIISILASILFPVFARARKNARRASCQSNLKQIGLGVMMYAQDNDERYPFGGTTLAIWTEVISPYTSHYSARTQLYRCPSSSLTILGGNFSDFQYGNYAANVAVLTPGSVATPVSLSLAAMPSPAGTYMIFDGSLPSMSANYVNAPNLSKEQYIPGTGSGSPNNLSDHSTKAISHPELESDFESGRHFGGINMLFADGHVKWLQSQIVVAEVGDCKWLGCIPTNPPPSYPSAWNPWVDHN